jgi:thioredoxin-like negative regulator of GroEL
MIDLPSQEFLESLIVRNPEKQKPKHRFIIVYFTAKWCKACKALNTKALEALRNDIIWYKCDIDMHQYTATYCSVSSIPSFMAIVDGRCSQTISRFTEEQLRQWIIRLGQ